MKTTSRYQNTALHLLRFYPRAWRKRYADEISAVLEERPATLRTVFDLSLGMIDAHIHRTFLTEKEFSMQQRLRDSQVTIFAAFFLFAIAWLFYALVLSHYWEYGRWAVPPYWPAPYPGLARVNNHLALQMMNICGLGAVAVTLLGAIVLIAITVKQTLKQRQKSFTLFGVAWLLSIIPTISLFNWLMQHSLFFYYNHRLHNALLWDILSVLPFLPMIWWLFVGPACLVLGTRKAELTSRLTQLAFIPTTVITLCMSVILGAMIYLALGVSLNAPQIATLYSSLALDVLVLWMAGLTVLCYISLWRGWQTHHKLKLA